jgi:hypothetical protein
MYSAPFSRQRYSEQASILPLLFGGLMILANAVGTVSSDIARYSANKYRMLKCLQTGSFCGIYAVLQSVISRL